MKYIIKKEVEAKDISDALKKESKSNIIEIYSKEEVDKVGF